MSRRAKADPATDGVARDYELRWEEREFREIRSACFDCHETISRRYGRPARQHITSAHYRAAVTCHECHGGDPEAEEEETAHDLDKGFLGVLELPEMLQRCGVCHRHEVRTFIESKHHAEYEGVQRVTCMSCHGAHDLGAGARPPEFSWPATCAECHDLENVADLPPELTGMLARKDAAYARLRELRIRLSNRPFDPDVMEPLRAVRQRSADLIHATRAEGIQAALQEIVTRTEALEATIEARLAP